MRKPRIKLLFVSAASLLLLLVGACTPQIPADALKLSPETLEQRALQTRKYEGIAEKKLLAASAGIMQDLGFNLDESETKLGVLVGSKDRGAQETGQVLAAIFLSVFTGAPALYDHKQRIRMALVIRPTTEDNNKDHYVRVTFQRAVWDNRNNISKVEGINDQEIYQQFFNRLSKSVFLEAQEI